MKRLLLINLCFLACLAAWGEQTTIQMFRDIRDEVLKDRRSLSILPTVSYDGNTIFINSYIHIEDLQILVKDADNNVVYSDLAYLPAGNTLSLVLDVVSGEEYVIELAYGDTFLFGRFTP